MNSYFRRDYIYQLKPNTENSLSAKLRYIGFDRTKKEYVFSESLTPMAQELQIRIHSNNRMNFLKRVEKLYHIGYLNTVGYNKNLKYQSLQPLNLASFSKRVTDEAELVEGFRYKIEILDSNRAYITDADFYTYLGARRFESDFGLKQSIHDSWIKDGVIEVNRVI